MIVCYIFLICSSFYFGFLSTHAKELISTGDFEEDDSTSSWFCQGNCTLQRDTDSHKGNYSIKVSDR